MVKFLKLLKNENKKELKKISTKIFIFVSIFTIILAVFFVMLIKWLGNIGIDSVDNYWKESIKNDIEIAEENLSEAEKVNNKQEAMNLETQIKFYKYALDNELNIYSSYRFWKVEALQDLINNAATLNIYDSNDLTKIDEQNKKIDNLLKLIEDDDFIGYIQVKKNELKANLISKIITREQYDNSIEYLEIKEKYEIGKTEDKNEVWKIEVLNEIRNLKEDLKNNMDLYTRKLLTYEQRQEKENTIKIDMYRLENNIAPIGNYIGETNYRSYYDMVSESFVMIVISVLIIMMAGGTIATEHSKGTIKFLIMTPNKRWKILLAKLVNIVLIMIILTIIVSIISVVVGNIFFAGYKTSPYLFVQNGEVYELNHTIYTILRFLTYDIDIFVYLLFALMLSVITRNTAASIGVSIATYLGNGIAMTIINAFVKSDWIKFIPFNNLGLTDRIFTNTTTLITGKVSSLVNNVSVTFSLIILGICAVLMLVTAFDSFNKRDIK